MERTSNEDVTRLMCGSGRSLWILTTGVKTTLGMITLLAMSFIIISIMRRTMQRGIMQGKLLLLLLWAGIAEGELSAMAHGMAT
jgi:hypothetical protein